VRSAIVLAALTGGAVAQQLYAPDVRAATIASGALLVLVLPGLALTELLFAPRSLDGPRRALLVPALSICVAIVAGIGLDAADVRLDRDSWAVVLGAVAGLAAVGAALHPGRRRRPRRLELRVSRHASALAVAAMLLAVAAATALVVSVRPVGAEHVAGYAGLGLVPARSGGFDLSVRSVELERARFAVVVRALPSERVLLRKTLVLEPNQSWSAHLAQPKGKGVLVAQLERGRQTGYRSVHVAYTAQEHGP
jgi:hypothetical protein